MRLTALAVLAVVTASVVTGCVGGDPAVRAEASAEGPSTRPTATDGPGTGAAPPENPSSDPHGELACSDGDLAEIDEVIDAQLAAFVDDDYAGALDLASQDFRDSFDEESFRTVIEDGFPIVTEATGHDADVCVRRGDEAQLLVTVQGGGDEEAELVYRMVVEDDAWRINGAEPAQARDDGIRV